MNKIKYKIQYVSGQETIVSANGFQEAIIRGLNYALDKALVPTIKLVTNMEDKSSMKNIKINYSPNL